MHPSKATVYENTIRWEIESISGTSKMGYILNAPIVANGDAHFSGTVNEDPIGGDMVMKFHTPTPGKQIPLHSSLYNYWLYLPSNYSDQEGKWPVILFLHGSCVIGTSFDLVLTHYDVSVLTLLQNPDNVEIVPELFQSIVVSPQSSSSSWDRQSLNDFLSELLSTYSINSNRVYLIGHGMAAAGAWEFANEYPESVTAFVSIIGSTIPTGTENIATVPFWIFQNESTKDQFEPMLNQVRSQGGTVISTIYSSETDAETLFNRRCWTR